MIAAMLARVAPQGFRPGLRTIAPIRGLKTSIQPVGVLDQIVVLVLDMYYSLNS
jgi:hypothetical protein